MNSLIIALIGAAVQITLSVAIAKKVAKLEVAKWNGCNPEN